MFAYSEQNSFLQLGEENDTHGPIDRQLQTAYEAKILLIQLGRHTAVAATILHISCHKTLIHAINVFVLSLQQLDASVQCIMRRIANINRSISRKTRSNKQRFKWILFC